MPSRPNEEIYAFAKWLTQACRHAGLRAEQYGSMIRINGVSNHLSEEITCHADEAGALRWWWSWGQAIADLHDAERILTPDDVDDLVQAIGNVVSAPLRPQW